MEPARYPHLTLSSSDVAVFQRNTLNKKNNKNGSERHKHGHKKDDNYSANVAYPGNLKLIMYSFI